MRMLSVVVGVFAYLTCSNGTTFGEHAAAQEGSEPMITATISETHTIIFENHSEETIRLLKPVDGSAYRRILPYWVFSATDNMGNEVNLMPRCGVINPPLSASELAENYLIVIEPGATHEAYANINLDFKANETYLLSFEYHFFTEGDLPFPDAEYPPGLWTGTIIAEPVPYCIEGPDASP